jgi:hypothetical protein
MNPSLDRVSAAHDRALPSATIGVAKYDTYAPAAHVVSASSAARRSFCLGVSRFDSASSSFVAYVVRARADAAPRRAAPRASVATRIARARRPVRRRRARACADSCAKV